MSNEIVENYSAFAGETVDQIIQIKSIIAGAFSLNLHRDGNAEISNILFNVEQQLAKVAANVSNTEFKYETKNGDID